MYSVRVAIFIKTSCSIHVRNCSTIFTGTNVCAVAAPYNVACVHRTQFAFADLEICREENHRVENHMNDHITGFRVGKMITI